MKKEYKDFDIEEEIRREKTFEDNMTCAICSIGFSSATASIINVLTGCLDKPETLPYFIAGGVIATPVFFILTKKLRKKMDEKFRKDMVSAANLMSMMGEVFAQDRIIDENTSVFLTELDLKLSEEKIDLPHPQKYCINKLLYLINVNYFDDIAKKMSSLTREKLIDHIIKQTVSYYKRTKKQTFDENDAKEIIDYCILIRPELKEKIIKEFKSSKVKIANEIDYAIEKKETKHLVEIDSFETFLTSVKNNKGYNFDITSESDLNAIILAASKSEFYNKYGDPDKLSWDMDFLHRVLTLIATNYRQELIDYHNNFSNLELASSLITNSITYALVNKRDFVGQREIISTFKNWHYIPFGLQDKILTKLFEEDGIDYSLHPYRERRDPAIAKKPKIIKLSENFFKKGTTTEE